MVDDHAKERTDMEGLTEGRIVHYVLNEGRDKGEHRPAIVVRVWRVFEADMITKSAPENGCCQLQVFTDSDEHGKYNDELSPVMWKTSVIYDESGKPGTWHWIEKA
jgi:hypothetical protein